MCAPAIVLAPMIAGLAIQGVSSIASTASARGQAGRAQDANNKLVNDTRASATENTRQALQDLDARQLEEMLAAAQQQEQNTRTGNTNRSTAIVAAGESGVTGNSVDELLNDVQAQTTRNRGTIQTNSNITQAQLMRDRDQAIASGKSQYNSVQPQKINKPSYLSSILGIAGGALNTVDALQSRSAKIGNINDTSAAVKASSHMTDYVLGG